MSEGEKREEKRGRSALEDYLRGYALGKKIVAAERYEKEFLGSEGECEVFGEVALARAKMFEIRHFIMNMENSDEKLLLYYHYIKGESVERCGELLGVSRSSAFRMKARALALAERHFHKKEA